MPFITRSELILVMHYGTCVARYRDRDYDTIRYKFNGTPMIVRLRGRQNGLNWVSMSNVHPTFARQRFRSLCRSHEFKIITLTQRGATGSTLDFRSTGRGFKILLGAKLRYNLVQVVNTYVPLVTKQYNLVPAKGL